MSIHALVSMLGEDCILEQGTKGWPEPHHKVVRALHRPFNKGSLKMSPHELAHSNKRVPMQSGGG